MTKEEIIKEVQDYIKSDSQGDSSGHDWWHVFRTWKMAKEIAKKEGGDLFVIELGALLHDIGDWKFNDDPKAGSKKARELLEKLKVEEPVIAYVCDIVDNVSFKGAKMENGIKTLEGKIVQDADRLDALGAIGVARTFAFGGSANRELYIPEFKPSFEKVAYSIKDKRLGGSLNHFYEKLLLIKDMLNTKTAKKIAGPRHKFLEMYLKEFLKEWEVKI
jgi:uncharacterized protein